MLINWLPCPAFLVNYIKITELERSFFVLGLFQFKNSRPIYKAAPSPHYYYPKLAAADDDFVFVATKLLQNKLIQN